MIALPRWFDPDVLSGDRCPLPLFKEDAAALIGIVARLQGESLSKQLDPELEAALAARLQRDGIATTADSPGLQAALVGLNERLREALGEHVNP